MLKNTIVHTIKLTYREDFEQQTSEKIMDGYTMISAGYNMNADGKRGYWWAVLVKEVMPE